MRGTSVSLTWCLYAPWPAPLGTPAPVHLHCIPSECGTVTVPASAEPEPDWGCIHRNSQAEELLTFPFTSRDSARTTRSIAPPIFRARKDPLRIHDFLNEEHLPGTSLGSEASESTCLPNHWPGLDTHHPHAARPHSVRPLQLSMLPSPGLVTSSLLYYTYPLA